MDNITIQAVAEVLKEEREITDNQIANILEKLGDSGLIPRLMISRLEAQKEAVQKYCDDVLLKRSKLKISLTI